MSTVGSWMPRRDWFTVSTDRQAVYLVGLFLLVQAAAVALGLRLASQGVTVESPGNVDGAAAGAGFAAVEVAFAGVLLGLIYLGRYLPEEMRKALKVSVLVSLCYLLGWFGGGTSAPLLVLGMLLGFYLGVKTIDVLGVWWLPNNLASILLAIYGAAALGLAFNEWALLTFMLGMTAYDRYFADRKKWMMSLAGGLIKLRLPVIFVKPTRYRFDWNDLFDEDADALDDTGSSWGIGTADLMLPAALTVAVATGESIAWPMVGAAAITAAVGVAALRIRQKMLTQGSGAGLPPLMMAVALSFAIVLLPSLVHGVVA